MELLKIRDVQSPNRGTPGSAGIDFFVPALNDDFLVSLYERNTKFFLQRTMDTLDDAKDILQAIKSIADGDKDAIVKLMSALVLAQGGKSFIEVPGGMDLCVPTGVKTKFNEGAFIAFNKSGISTKLKFVMGACVDDLDYQGELHMHVMNVSQKPAKVFFGMKLAQFIHVPVDLSTPAVYEGIPSEEFFSGSASLRGEGAFGSTNK